MGSLPDRTVVILASVHSSHDSPNRTLLTLFPTSDPKVSLFGELPYLDQRPADNIEFDDNNDYDLSEDAYTELPIELNAEKKVLRTSVTGYILKGVLDDDDYNISYRYLVQGSYNSCAFKFKTIF